MATRKTANNQNANTTPQDAGVGTSTPPSFSGHHDHSFTLQAIMELQKTVGQLSAEIKALAAASEKAAGKLDKIEDKVSGVTHKLYAAGVVITILLVVGGFIINKAWDMAANHITEIAKAAIVQPTAVSQIPPPKK
ncbi:hypothetical protein MASR1M60_15040 [Rhodocyclaceae bacterium]